MPTYLFRCDEGCEGKITVPIADFDAEMQRLSVMRCSEHDRPIKRKYTAFKFSMPFWDGYSPTTGTFTTSHRDLTEQMHIASEHATERTGIQHDFKPVDVRDTEALGVTAEGLDATNRRLHNEGRPLVKSKSLDL